MTEIDFHAWVRSGIYDLASPIAGEARVRGQVGLTLRNTMDTGEPPVTGTATFKLIGPPDVEGLRPRAITRTYPSPNAEAAEDTKLAMVELGAPDLPWRYTPELPTGPGNRRLRPWMVLVVGTDDEQPEIVEGASGNVTLGAAVIAAHPLADSAQFAHVQDGPRRLARIVSPRRLEANKRYLAALVPAFEATGSDAWAPGDAGVTVPSYHRWRFQTGPAGDFQTLAAQLKAHRASPSLGRATVAYPRTQPSTELSMRGALAPISGTDAALPNAVATDLAALRIPQQDPRGRDVIALPAYGAEWRDPAEATWGQQLNRDPRHRGAAGIGLHAGIALQDELARAARDQVGALGIAAQRIRSLTAGLQVARSLWNRRLPHDDAHRLALFWPTTARLATDGGTARAAITAADRPLPPSLFSSGARRALRRGPARTQLARPGAASPAAVLDRANRCPQPAPDAPDGLPHVDTLAKTLGIAPISEQLRQVAESGKMPLDRLVEQAERFVDALRQAGYDDALIRAVLDCLDTALARNDVRRIAELIAALDESTPTNPEKLLMRLRDCMGEHPDDSRDLLDVVGLVLRPPKPRRCLPVDIGQLVHVLAGTIDPTSPSAPAIVRVLGTITGLGTEPLSPPEPCVGLDLPAWRYLRDHDWEWLLPGVSELESHAVVAVESNPTFVESFLVGLNHQTLHEMRWRNIPVATHCTPLRVFWDRVNVSVNARVDDIVGIRDWPATTSLAAPQHRPPGVTGTNLVLVFRSPLFQRYPATIVSLTPALVDGQPDWDATPDMGPANRLSPSFQGKIGDDITFFGFAIAPAEARNHWVVLEEPPPGYLFRHPQAFVQDPPDMTGVSDGATFADKTFNNPTLVLIRGDELVPEAQ
jgi:hypothetical protein